MDQIKKSFIEEYWLKKLGRDLPAITLPLVNETNREITPASSPHPYQTIISEALSQKLIKIAKNSDLGLFILFLAALNIGLHKYTGTEDLLLGILPPTTEPGQQHILFSRVTLTADLTPKEVINQTNQEIVDAINHAEFSLESVLNELQIKNDNKPVDIFNVAFVHGPKPESDPFLRRFDLVFTLSPCHLPLILEVTHPTNPGAREMVERFTKNMLHILEGLFENIEKKLVSLDAVNHEEKKRLLSEFNQTAVPYPKDKTISQMFEGQVEKTGNSIALVGLLANYSSEQIVQVTYSELNQSSHRLMHILKEKGISNGYIVGLTVNRSIEMMVAILAILKAGAAYLPIDPGFPSERINYMLKDSGAKLLLTTSSVQEKRSPQTTEANQVEYVLVDHPVPPTQPFSTPMAAEPVQPANPAYIIYTSGTTGRPKGVIIENRAVVNFIKGITDIIPFRSDDNILALTTISFDIFGLETILPLTTGSKVVIGNENAQLNPTLAADIITTENITIFQSTPSRFQLFILNRDTSHSLRGLKYLVVGGEALPATLLEELRKLTTGKIYNVYGPTETTIWSTIKDLSGKEPLNIGKPLANTYIYILNRSGLVQPIGVSGELYIGGDGVARGYINQPELTLEKFVPNRFLAGQDQRMYRTGDLSRWLPNGNIEFLGRMDAQVKIRGFRIELEEIEKTIQSRQYIKDAVVSLETEQNEKFLCAYIVANGEPNILELRQYLSTSLPEYMIPSYFVQIDAIPLTPSGKIDRKALHKQGGRRLTTKTTYVAPSSGLEKIIADLWKEVLQLDKVSIHDNFFEMGGNSMNLIQLNNKLAQLLNRDIPVVSMFQYLTISSFTQYLIKTNVNNTHSELKAKRNEDSILARDKYKLAVKRFKKE